MKSRPNAKILEQADREAQAKAAAIREGVACLTLGGFEKGG